MACVLYVCMYGRTRTKRSHICTSHFSAKRSIHGAARLMRCLFIVSDNTKQNLYRSYSPRWRIYVRRIFCDSTAHGTHWTLDIGQGYFYFDSFAVFVLRVCVHSVPLYTDSFRVSHTLCGCAYNWTWTRHMWVRQPANVMRYKIRCPSQTNCLLHKFSAKFIQNVWTWHSPAVTVNVSFITSRVCYVCLFCSEIRFNEHRPSATIEINGLRSLMTEIENETNGCCLDQTPIVSCPYAFNLSTFLHFSPVDRR